MDSGLGFMHTLAIAERDHEGRRAAGWEDAYAQLYWDDIDACGWGWLWRARAEALEALILGIKNRYPEDAMFRATGRTRPNGSPELAIHQAYDREFERFFVVPPGDTRDNAIGNEPVFHKKRAL